MEIESVTIDSENALACPGCGLYNLHHEAVEVDVETEIHDRGIRIRFRCEHCSDKKPELLIYQHEGTTFVEWTFVERTGVEGKPQ